MNVQIVALLVCALTIAQGGIQGTAQRAVGPAWEIAASGVQGFLKGTEERRQAQK